MSSTSRGLTNERIVRRLLTTICVAIFFSPFAANGSRCVWSQEDPSAPCDALVDEFFTLTSEFDSPLLRDRDLAEEELTRRFVEFEPVWQDRAFLTDGEISAEARQRFEFCEARWRRETFDRAHETFQAAWTLKRGAERGSVRISWSEPMRVVYLVPVFETFLWRDPLELLELRPAAIHSAPEILPEVDEQFVELETKLDFANSTQKGESERDGDIVDSLDAERRADGIGSVEVLAGLELREWILPVSIDDRKRRVFRSGDLTLDAPIAKRREKGGWIVRLGLEYDFVFDAFDSHRAWLVKDDFALKIAGSDQKLKPVRTRFRARNARGVDVELEFADDLELDSALADGRCRLICRAPRFLARMKIIL